MIFLFFIILELSDFWAKVGISKELQVIYHI